MSTVQNGQRPVTKQDLADFYQGILPYMGGMPEVLANKFSKGDLYDTTERMIGKWINGKPLYQITVTGTSPTTQATTANIIDISSLGADLVLIKNGYCVDDGGSWRVLNCYFNDGSVNGIATWIRWDKTHVAMCVNNGECLNKDVVVILNYTKTADSANSFNIGDATDYSTDEKIIGTWLNGEPLYQKTLSTTMPTNTEVGIDVTSLNIAHIVSYSGFHFDADYEGTFPVANSGAAGQTCFPYYVRSTSSLNVYNNISGYAGRTVYITIQYTKTT